MTGEQLRATRIAMGLTQAQFGERLKLTGNSVARMERDEVAITEPMALLVSYVAKDAGIDSADGQRSRGTAADKKANRSKARDSIRPSGRRQGR